MDEDQCHESQVIEVVHHYRFDSTLWNALKWVKWGLLAIAVTSVIWVDQYAGSHRAQSAVEENKRDLKMIWDISSLLIAKDGFGALPVQEQESWESLDIYVIEVDKAEFVTLPRFNPMRELVRKKLAGETDRVVDCWTEQVKLARNGQEGTGVFPDYRGVPVISAYGTVNCDDADYVLLVEMDRKEAVGVSPANYWDEILVTACCSGVVALIYFVHQHRDNLNRVAIETEEAARKVIEINEALTRQVGTGNNVSSISMPAYVKKIQESMDE